jgi:hypothetical protein
MTNDYKSEQSKDYYNVSQSDVRALVRGELKILKATLSTAKNRAVNTETKYHYQDCISRIDLILDPK